MQPDHGHGRLHALAEQLVEGQLARSIALGIAPTPGSTIAPASRTPRWSRRKAAPTCSAPSRPSAGSPCRSRGSRRASGALGRGHALDALVLLDRGAQGRANALNDASTMW